MSQEKAPRIAAPTVPSKVVRTTRHGKDAGRTADEPTTKSTRRTRYEEDPREEADRVAAKRARKSEYEDDPRDMRSKLAQNKVDKSGEKEKQKNTTRQNQTRRLNAGCLASHSRSDRPESLGGSS